MDKLLEKISSYSIFTNLFPGIVFCFLVEQIYSYKIFDGDLVTGVFIYYFVGLVISRIGSILVEPILQKFRVVQYASYSDFLVASKVDPKLDVLLEVNNTYRSSLSLILCVALVGGGSWFFSFFDFLTPYWESILLASILVLFAISYRKQTGYIRKRVEKNKDTTFDGVS